MHRDDNKGLKFSAVLITALLMAPTAIRGESIRNEEAYGFVRRKQMTNNRVVFQPVYGVFLKDTDTFIHDMKGKVLCKGRVTSVYKDEIYAALDNCDIFDVIEIGQVVSSNGSSDNVIAVYKNRSSLEQAQREKEWNRSAGVPMELGEDNYKLMIETSSLPVFVEFYAVWCPVCQRYIPILGNIAKELEGLVRVAAVDAEKNRTLAKDLDVKSYPTLFLYSNGRIISRWSAGAKNSEPIVKFIKEKLNLGKK